MKLGLQINRFKYPKNTGIGVGLATLARGAEAAGLDSIWVMDHFFQIPRNGPAEDAMLEGYAALSFMAAATERVSLGTMVTGATYRHPGVLIKTATTLDVLSGGRSYLGIGAGWFEREHLGLGVPFPPLKERFERLEETLRIAHQMWSGEVGQFHGTHYQLEETLNQPMPVSQPHPPILIGGGGEKKTLRFVAKYGDACNLFVPSLDQVRHKLNVLQSHCDTEGRLYSEIEKTTIASIGRLSRTGESETRSPQEVIELLGHLAELGVDHHLFSMPDLTDQAQWEIIASDIVPAARSLTVAGRI